MRAFASRGLFRLGLAALLCALARTAAAAEPQLPEIRSIEAPACVDAGSEISVSGKHLGPGTDGWSLELAGVALQTREWSDGAIRAEVPGAIRETPSAEKPSLILRSQSGGLLARAGQLVRLCEGAEPRRAEAERSAAQSTGEPPGAAAGDGPGDPGSDREAPPKRGVAPLSPPPLSPERPSADFGAQVAEPVLEGELLIGVPDLATAATVEQSALALDPREPARRSELGPLGFVMVRLRFADREAADAAARRLRELYPQLAIVPNQVYKREDGFHALPAEPPLLRGGARPQGLDPWSAFWELRDQIHWPRRPDCGSGRRVGIIDTGVNTAHPELRAAQVTTKSLLPDATTPLDAAQHGTAIASLLVGQSLGLIPSAHLYAASVFWKQGGQIVSSAEQIVRGIAWLVSEQVDVINLSLTGPENALVAAALRRAHEQGIVAVAAAGNDGPEQAVAFPASLRDVVAVTAVDLRMQIYPHAARGAIDLAAPGVDVLVAGAGGMRQSLAVASGTSYAVPFVSAALILHPRGLRGLEETALDLGSPGVDPVFGWGLLQAGGLCTHPAE